MSLSIKVKKNIQKMNDYFLKLAKSKNELSKNEALVFYKLVELIQDYHQELENDNLGIAELMELQINFYFKKLLIF